MANNTIYPYGTGGQMPSGIPIVNDLETGGADKALSAEMGVALKALIDGTIVEVIEDGFYIIDSDRNIGFYVGEDGIATLIMSVLSSLFATTTEDGFYIVDSDRNIGFMVNVNGAHSANLVEY